MTATRRNKAQHQQMIEGEEEEIANTMSSSSDISTPSRSKKRKQPKEETEETPTESQSSEFSQAGPSQRPKRNTRKSVLLNDFEVSMPGASVKIEEEDNEEDIDVELESESSSSQAQHFSRVLKAKKANQLHTVEVEPIFEEEATDDSMITMNESDEELVEEDPDGPPLLELSVNLRKSRGRPRKYEATPVRYHRRRTAAENFEIRYTTPLLQKVLEDDCGHGGRKRFSADKPITKTEADRINTYNIKVFQDQIDESPSGDRYATVIPGCLAYLLRKEKILELLTSESEIQHIQEHGWMINRIPRLPPLTDGKACFAFYIDGSEIQLPREITCDDLRPWSSNGTIYGGYLQGNNNDPLVKPNVRKHSVVHDGEAYILMKGEQKNAHVLMIEYTAWLPRCLRLRKKAYYMTRDGHIIGNILILYDYTQAGDIPEVLNLPHGNTAIYRDMSLRTADEDYDLFSRDSKGVGVTDYDNPFEEGVVKGPVGGKFLKVSQDKMNWLNNKRNLLKYLINDPNYIEENGYMNNRVPYLPPLVEERTMFVYFAPANQVANQLHHVGDGLSPWNHGSVVNNKVRSQKRALIQDAQGVFRLSREEWHKTGLALVETVSVLSRCPRLRKRVLFVQKTNMTVLGAVAYVYEYTHDGPAPVAIRHNYKACNMSTMQAEATMKSNGYMNNKRDMDEIIDVEDIVDEEVMEFDIDDTLITSNIVEEANHPDCLDNGWDNEFNNARYAMEDESLEPYYDGVRHLSTGHSYLTVRHKRTACNVDTVLEYICNASHVENKHLLNDSKPMHPPLVRNQRAYSFFVMGDTILSHDINRDDFSPWSANATDENPTCYRSKVKKIGLQSAINGGYESTDIEWKLCQYHLVHLYSIHPKEVRLRKKIYYVMNTKTRQICSHVLIMYDYNVEGQIPRVNGPYQKRTYRRQMKYSREMMSREVHDDVSDVSETEKESPFLDGARMTNEGCIYFHVEDLTFITDRNRQLNYLYNYPRLIDPIECLNKSVPQLPPLIAEKGAFAFFVDNTVVDVRNLTCDSLAPWSESLKMADGSMMSRRPKSHKVPMGVNKAGHLRIIRGARPEGAEYVMHIYAATLPRLPRLKKRVVYLLKDGEAIGNSLVIYWFTSSGPLPTPAIHGNTVYSEQPYARVPPSIRDEARELLTKVTPLEAARYLSAKSALPITTRTMYHIRREMRKELDNPKGGHPEYTYVYNENNDDEWGYNKRIRNPADVIDAMAAIARDDSIQVAHTEEGGAESATSPKKKSSHTRSTERKAQDVVIYGFAQEQYRSTNDEGTCDAIWRLLLAKNERRLLNNIRQDFGIEITAQISEFPYDEGLEDMLLEEEKHNVVTYAQPGTETHDEVEDDHQDVEVEEDHEDLVEEVEIEEEGVVIEELENAMVDEDYDNVDEEIIEEEIVLDDSLNS